MSRFAIFCAWVRNEARTANAWVLAWSGRWPEMRIADFRSAVLREFPRAEFCAPDALDSDWMFKIQPQDVE